MKNKLLLLLVILSLAYVVDGQYIIPTSELIRDYSGQIRKSVNKTLTKIEGTPYLYDGFQTGLVFPKYSENPFKLDLNINAYTDMFEFEYEGKVYEMPNHSIDSVLLGSSTFIPVGVFEENKVQFYSMEVLARDGANNFLVKQYVVNFLEATTARAYHSADPPRYQAYPPNYFIYNKEEKRIIPLRNIKSLKKYPEFTDILSSYLKKNRVRPRNISDLKELFYYLYPGT